MGYLWVFPCMKTASGIYIYIGYHEMSLSMVKLRLVMS